MLISLISFAVNTIPSGAQADIDTHICIPSCCTYTLLDISIQALLLLTHIRVDQRTCHLDNVRDDHILDKYVRTLSEQ